MKCEVLILDVYNNIYVILSLLFSDGKIVVLAWYNELQTDNKLTWNNSTHVLWINGRFLMIFLFIICHVYIGGM